VRGGGRGDKVAFVAQGKGGPSRVRLGRLGVDAPVSAIGIDLKSGALGIPENIKRVGWWRDGAEPGATTGTVLLAGHVDSAKEGAGAFYALKSARRGDVVTLQAGGKTLRYRVTGTRRVAKAALPSSIYTRTGPARLVLVTCGGPFDARAGHYRDNIIVTAVPS
jgi:LPXTG-site transpeptidase (sortase) family protein